MYIPTAFDESRIEEQHALIRANPLGLLISAGPEGPLASPLPFLLVPSPDGPGTLQTHLARANPHWKSLDGQPVLVVFQGPDAYVRPGWYPSKAEHGRVVPTWNYAMVQARGLARVMDDEDWLRSQITRLTETHEGGRPKPWSPADTPDGFIDGHIKAIVGIEIVVRQLEGKWKASQNRSPEDRRGVAEGLAAEGQQAMAELVRRYGGIDPK
jgi:transcriptional regulator